MLYSASRRCDMVAFSPDPIVEKVDRSRKLDGIVFWTKDITNLAVHPGLVRITEKYPSIIQYTVTGLAGTVWEPGVPSFEQQRASLKTIAKRLPQGAVRWRFDPVIATPDIRTRFSKVRKALSAALGEPREVTVSFPDPYRKAVARVSASGLPWPETDSAEQRDIIEFMVEEMGGAAGSPVRLCCEPALLVLPGVGKSRCIDDLLFKRLYGLDLGGLDKDQGQRQACGCVKSTDIGSYDIACPHRCRYCYANPEE